MTEPSRVLPADPSLEQQKKLAKELLKEFQAGAAAARERVRRHLPDKPRIRLTDAQFVLAREYGFDSWSKLKAHIEALAAAKAAESVDGAEAAATAAELPAAVREAFGRAFEARDAGAVRELLERHPAARALINAPLCPFDSPPLVHIAGSGDRAMVDVLLEFGADPNRRSDWWAGGFHVLHNVRGPMADHLIEAGAVPDACGAANLDRPELLREMLDAEPECVHERGGDGQTPLHFARSREVVDLLLERGADLEARDVDHRATPTQWMLERRKGAGRYELAAYLVERGASADVFLAAALGLTGRLHELLAADPSLLQHRTGQGEYAEEPPGSFHIYTWTIGQNLSPFQVAAQFEQDETYELLSGFASPKDRFLAACAGGRDAEALRLKHEQPGLVEGLTTDEQRILPDAAWAGDARAVDLMLELGFDPATPGQDGGTALHCAAWQGAAVCVDAALRHAGVRALIERRDAVHGSTPLGWCCHGARHGRNPEGDYPAVARLLLEAGARPGPNLEDAPEEVEAVLQAHGTSSA